MERCWRLDQARTSTGFFPVSNPNQQKGAGRGSWKGRTSNGSPPDYSDKICMRCGKRGHIARQCPQRPVYGGKGRGREGSQALFLRFTCGDGFDEGATEDYVISWSVRRTRLHYVGGLHGVRTKMNPPASAHMQRSWTRFAARPSSTPLPPSLREHSGGRHTAGSCTMLAWPTLASTRPRR